MMQLLLFFFLTFCVTNIHRVYVSLHFTNSVCRCLLQIFDTFLVNFSLLIHFSTEHFMYLERVFSCAGAESICVRSWCVQNCSFAGMEWRPSYCCILVPSFCVLQFRFSNHFYLRGVCRKFPAEYYALLICFAFVCVCFFSDLLSYAVSVLHLLFLLAISLQIGLPIRYFYSFILFYLSFFSYLK